MSGEDAILFIFMNFFSSSRYRKTMRWKRVLTIICRECNLHLIVVKLKSRKRKFSLETSLIIYRMTKGDTNNVNILHIRVREGKNWGMENFYNLWQSSLPATKKMFCDGKKQTPARRHRVVCSSFNMSDEWNFLMRGWKINIFVVYCVVRMTHSMKM